MTHRIFRRILVIPVVVMLAAAGCTSSATGNDDTSSSGKASSVAAYHASVAGTAFDPTKIHSISVDISEKVLVDLLDAYADTGKKKWGRAAITIDGTKFAAAGIRLKGNSSLRGVTATSAPEDLPWRIRLDKYIGGREIDGFSDFIVRSNSSETSMNEAVSLDMIAEAGLASEHAIETAFSVNGSDQRLRLTLQGLDQAWVDEHFPDAGGGSVLYKSEANGDWTWRGAGGDYSASFGIKSGPKNYDPLIALLELVNNGSDDDIAERLPDLVNLDSFADYLAVQDLINNRDDIDGPGNNSYLFWDASTKQFTVVAWDHNLAFDVKPSGPRGSNSSSGPDSSDRPGSFGGVDGPRGPGGSTAPKPPDASHGVKNQKPPEAPGGADGHSNPLVAAFNANKEFHELYTEAHARLTTKLIDDGAAADSVHHWANLLKDDGGQLVSADTVDRDVAHIQSQLRR